jgi:hydroxymethylbilane synthase
MRLGTRGSALALAQARQVAEFLPGAEIVPMTVTGDRGERAGDKSRWVTELEEALLDGRIDLAVHSAKDVPGELAVGLAIVGVPARGDARDALCGAAALEDLPAGARVGTSSLRRRSQLLAARADLEVADMRGNVDTRLRKLAEGEWDAIVLALAGLERLGRAGEAGGALDPATFVPAPGQGALAVEARTDDEDVRAALAGLNDPGALTCLLAERALVVELGASCRTPVGAHATLAGDELALRAWVGLPDGSAWALDELSGPAEDPASLGRAVAARLLAAGAGELLERAEALA